MKKHTLLPLATSLTLIVTACNPPVGNVTTSPSPTPTTVPASAPTDATTTNRLQLRIKGDETLARFSVQQQSQGVCLTDLSQIESELRFSSELSTELQTALSALGANIDGNRVIFSAAVSDTSAFITGVELTLPGLPVGVLQVITQLKDSEGNSMGSVSYTIDIQESNQNVDLSFKPAEGAQGVCVLLNPELTGASLSSVAGGVSLSDVSGSETSPTIPSSVPSESPSGIPSTSPSTNAPSQIAALKLDINNRFLTKDGEERQLSALLLDAASNPVSQNGAVIQWTTNRPQDVSVDTQGNIKALTGLGFSRITAQVVGTTIQDSILIDISDPDFFTSFGSSTPLPTPTPEPTPTPVPTPTPIPPLAVAQKAGGEIRVNTTTDFDQETANISMRKNGEFVAVWRSGAGPLGFEIMAQRFTADGTKTGGEIAISSPRANQSAPQVALSENGTFVTTWVITPNVDNNGDGDSGGIYMQPSNGPLAGFTFPVNTTTAGNQSQPTVAIDANGNYVIAWSSVGQDGEGSGIYMQRYDANNATVGANTLVNTTTANDQSEPNIAMDASGNYVITWTSTDQDGSGDGVYAQRFDASGNKVGNEILVNTTTASFQNNPQVAIEDNGDFVIAWRGDGDGSLDGIFAQRFDAEGNKLGTEIAVNTTTDGEQFDPSISMDADGDFVIAWSSTNGSDPGGVYAQAFNRDGTRNGDEFLVNTTTTDLQHEPTVAMDEDGDIVFAWSSENQDGDKFGVYAQRFNR